MKKPLIMVSLLFCASLCIGNACSSKEDANQKTTSASTDKNKTAELADRKDADNDANTESENGSLHAASFDRNSPLQELSFQKKLLLGTEKIPAPFLADLMQRRDISHVLGETPPLMERNLQGRANSPTYQAIRFATDKGFGISLELFRVENRGDIRETVQDYQGSSLDAHRIPGSSTSVMSTSLHIRTLILGSLDTRFVTMISCSVDLCSKEELKALGSIVISRLEGTQK